MATWGLATAVSMIQQAYEEKQQKKLDAKLLAEEGQEFVDARHTRYDEYLKTVKWYQTPTPYHKFK